MFASVSLLVLGLALILLAEASGRLWIQARHGVPGKRYGLWMADPILGAVHAPNAFSRLTRTNNVGLRDHDDVLAKSPGERRILCLGGSSTFCYNLPDGQTWPEQLEDILRRRPGHERDRVLNGGRVAWSLAHLLEQSRRDMASLQPDIVVIYSGINEPLNARRLQDEDADFEGMLARGEWGRFTTRLDQCRWLYRNTVVAKLWHVKLAPLVSSPDPAWADGPAETWAAFNYEKCLDAIIALAREQGAEPIFVVEVGTFDFNGYRLAFSEAGARHSRDLGVRVIDPRPSFASAGLQERLLSSHTGLHVTAEGAQLLASLVADELAEPGLADRVVTRPSAPETASQLDRSNDRPRAP